MPKDVPEVKPIERYNPRVEEPRWQKAWEDHRSFEVANDDPREPYTQLLVSSILPA